ncbi:M15 family metallopeptidase [Ruminococcus flavefaciens]|uniref:D-alanyl-D-alanine carboxypeptidase n=1 Tax=Ruminococcus flavefaciens TaxID=1265 RepID=A0A1K1PR77_RUMFL|nr:M15 family metallopeptidase [Ruminococcus flavefaciens]SFW49941.1 D-alanyl-D-alanine carboxypeptidase [Ruminococcus flavefaciens]
MKRISKITLILMAAASMTACGKVGERSSLPIPQQPAATVTEAATGTSAEESTTASDTTTTAAADSSETVTTTAADTEAATEAPAANTAAGSSDNTAAAPAQQQSAQTSSSSDNYGPAPVQYDDSRLTYINGVLIANKSYSLPADFAPGLDSTCYNQFCKLSNAAAQEGLNIYLSSGFRSYDYQAQIYNNYCARDGQAAADTYSARPGYSEHQTGLAIDVNQIDDSFIGTPEAIWLENHCHEFGFILRYPQGKQDITGYQYESWHIRYVGTDLATQIHNSGLTLEEYFGIDSYYH